jgi:hypothetical protein
MDPGESDKFIATFLTEATSPILFTTDPEGDFVIRADSTNALLRTDDPLCGTEENQVQSGGQGTSPARFPEICGDGIVNPLLGETCDPGPGAPPATPIDGDPGDVRNCRAAGTVGECTYCGDDQAGYKYYMQRR